MDKPRDDTAVDAYREHAAYTTSSVAADDEVAGLEAELKTCHLELKAEERNLEDLNEEVQSARAIFLQKDKTCDRVIRAFELRLQGLVNKKTKDPLYKRYFKDGLRAVTEAEPKEVEPELVEGMIKSLDEDLKKPEIGPVAKEVKPALEATLKDVTDTRGVLVAIEKTRDRVKNQNIPAIKARWVDAYVKLHAALRGQFPRDAARVESYFYAFAKSAAKASASGSAGGVAPPVTTAKLAASDGAEKKPA